MGDHSETVLFAGIVVIVFAIFAIPRDFFMGVTDWFKRRYGMATIGAVMGTFAIGGTFVIATPNRYPFAETAMGIFAIFVLAVFIVEHYLFWRIEYRPRKKGS